MADSVRAHFLYPPRFSSGSGFAPGPGGAMDEEGQPSILWGQGTPNGDLAPFNLVNKGSLYLSVDQTDDAACVYEKISEDGDNNDWALMLLSGAGGGSILIEALEVNAKSHVVVLPTLVDISAANSEAVEFHAVAELEIVEVGLLWSEATPASGSLEGDVTIGTATGGGQVVAATPYTASQAIGAYQALTIAEGTLAAGDSLFVSHDVADGSVGEYKVILKYYLAS